MKKLILVLVVVFVNCGTTKNSVRKADSKQYKSPPNGVQISDNFFADETEITNISYKEYLFWVKTVFGTESIEYETALPDTTVWNNDRIDFQESDLDKWYLKLLDFDSYPLVGVNYKQAEKYTSWRTDRVAEGLLIRKGLITVNREADASDCFTVDRYLKGGYKWIKKRETVEVPVFEIPTVEEWELIAGIESGFVYGTDSLSLANRKIVKNGICLYNTADCSSEVNNNEGTRPILFPNNTRLRSKNVFELYHTIGNVAELVKGEYVKGGSWKDNLEDISIEQNIKFEEPTNWIGFRNVSSYVVFELEDE